MMWFLIALGIGFVVYRYFSSMQQDSHELDNQSLSEKFRVIIDELNASAFNGKGSVTVHDKRNFNLYEDGQNQIIHFQYSTGILSVNWKYKYYQKEIEYKKDFNNVRNISIFEQKDIAEQIIKEVEVIISKHKSEVLGLNNSTTNITPIQLKELPYESLERYLKKMISTDFEERYPLKPLQSPTALQIDLLLNYVEMNRRVMIDWYDDVKAVFLEHDYSFPYSDVVFSSTVERVQREVLKEYLPDAEKHYEHFMPDPDFD